jgi:predicted dehydrogenase
LEEGKLIRVGVIGCGYWGPNLVRAFSDIDGVTVVRVSDLRPGRREFIEQRYPWIQTSANASDIIADPAIDAVVIATPPNTHHTLAIDALSAGKHLLVEKPLSTKSADAEEIVEVAARERRSLAVGHLFLYAPAFVEICSLAERGDLGDIYCITATRCNLAPPNTEIDVLWDLAPHDISMVLQLMGEAPKEVRATGACFTNTRFAEAVYLTLRFPSGRLAQVNVSWLTPAKTRMIQIIGSKRVVTYDDMQPLEKVRVFDPGLDNRAASDSQSKALGFSPGGISIPALKTYEPLRAECEDFIQSIRSGEPVRSDGGRALEVVRVLEAASRALQEGGQSVYSTEVAAGAVEVANE